MQTYRWKSVSSRGYFGCSRSTTEYHNSTEMLLNVKSPQPIWQPLNIITFLHIFILYILKTSFYTDEIDLQTVVRYTNHSLLLSQFSLYSVGPLVYILPKTFRLFDFPMCWLWKLPVKVVPEVRYPRGICNYYGHN
jgi:hypothetical protein